MKHPQAGRSKGQKAAEHKRAVAGGRAEAKQLRKHGPTKAQHQAALHWAAAGRRSQARKRAGKKPIKKHPRKLSPGAVDCCAAEALAASLRLTGIDVSGDDVLGLYWRTASGPDDGALLSVTLHAARDHGLAGWHPRYQPASSDELTPGTVYGYDEWQGIAAHAIAVWDGRAVSWGETYPLPGPADEAWAITWERT